MLRQIREKFRTFFDDPLGTATEWAVYLILLAVGIALVVWAVQLAFGILR